jgi:hypothetical protein
VKKIQYVFVKEIIDPPVAMRDSQATDLLATA